jgi:hypothetical protein
VNTGLWSLFVDQTYNVEMPLSEITVHKDSDDWADLDLPLSNLRREADGKTIVTARGLYKGRPVGFAVVLGAKWEEQPLESLSEPLRWGDVELISYGSESDAFLSVVAGAYGLPVDALKMIERTKFLAVSLSGDPILVDEEAIKLKLFFECDVEEEYAEFYLNIDRTRSVVEFHEKDTDYRKPIIRCLSSQ